MYYVMVSREDKRPFADAESAGTVEHAGGSTPVEAVNAAAALVVDFRRQGFICIDQDAVEGYWLLWKSGDEGAETFLHVDIVADMPLN